MLEIIHAWIGSVHCDRMPYHSLGSAPSQPSEPAISRTKAVRPDPSVIPEAFDAASELAFVRDVLAGREAAVVTFEERMLCVPRILGALNRRRGRPLDDHDLADLVQDTLLIVLRKLREFRAFVPLEGWIYRLCEFEFRNAVRRSGRQPQPRSEFSQLAATGSEPTAGHAHDELYRALDELGGVESEVIRMKHLAGFTFQEAAAKLTIPVNTAKTRYYRGMAKLAARMRDRRRREEDVE
jgi:RNA polymerase sigma factor (sigma-70 family)